MSPATTVTPLATYRNETPYPFCPGCGHGPILDALNAALTRLQLDPRRVVLVSDIGCAGLSDQYFVTSAFHGLHGRSITYASGVKLARPELTVVVIMGDGGTGIGGTHLINAARRNLGLTVLVCNNFNFGMTGGQHSTTTPPGAVTSTTPGGNLERPLDVCATAAVNGAAYAWRGTSFDPELADRMAEALTTRGFAVLDVWELCTAYFLPANKMSRKGLSKLLERLEFPTGVVAHREVAEYGAAYRAQAQAAGARRPPGPRPLPVDFASRLDRPFRLVVAGSAGGRVGSAARLVARAAVLSGLWAAQRADYPVTVKTGHSIAELILAPEPVDFTGVTRPDVLLVISEDGLRKAGGYLRAMAPDDRVFVTRNVREAAATAARVTTLDAPTLGAAHRGDALAALATVVAWLDLLPLQALRAAARLEPEQRRGPLLTSIQAGFARSPADPDANGAASAGAGGGMATETDSGAAARPRE